MAQRGKLDLSLCHWLSTSVVPEHLSALRAAVIGDIPGGDAGCRNSGNQRQTVGVGRYYDAGIAADVAVRVAVIVILVGRGVGLLPALFALMPVVAFIPAPSGIQVVGERKNRLIEGDLVPAVCVAENLLAAGADPVFDVSGGIRAAVGVNGGMILHIVSMVEFGNASRFRMRKIPLAGSRFAPLRGFCGGGHDVPSAPVVAKGGDRLRFRIVALRAGKSLYASFRAGGRFGFYALVPAMRQFFHDSLLDEHRIAHRAVLSLGQTGLRTGGGNGGVSDLLVPRGRDHRHIGFRVTAGTVSALTAVFGAGGGLVLGKIHSIVMPQLVCGDHIFLLLMVKRGVREYSRVCRQLFEGAGRGPRRFNGSCDGFRLFMTAIAGAYPLRRAVYSIPCISRFAVAVFEGSQCFRFFIVAHGTGIGLHARLRTGGWSFSSHLVIMGTLYLDAHFDLRRIVIVCVLWREHHGKNLLAGFRDRCTAVLPPEAARHIYVWGDIFILCLAAGEGAAPQRRAFRQVQRGGCRLCRDHRRGLIHRHLGHLAPCAGGLAVVLALGGGDRIVIVYPGSGHLWPLWELFPIAPVCAALVPCPRYGMPGVGGAPFAEPWFLSVEDGLIRCEMNSRGLLSGGQMPAGVEGMILRDSHHSIFGHPGAAGFFRVPAVKGVARVCGLRQCLGAGIGFAIGHGLACCADRAAVGVEGHGVLVSFPMGIERAARRAAHHCAGDDFRSAGQFRIPAVEGVAHAGGGGQCSVGFSIGHGHACFAHHAAVGVEVHRVGDGLGRDRPDDLPLIYV